MMTLSRLRAGLIVLVVLAAAGCGGDAPDGPIELVFGHVSAPGSLFAESAEEFARRVFALSSSILSSTIPEFGLFEMPYRPRSGAYMQRIEERLSGPSSRRV